jgi:putative SOS response-associated peptidase YedK
MCTRYITPEALDIERAWQVGARNPMPWSRNMFPRSMGPFIRAKRDATSPERELVVGQWGLIPWFAKASKLPYSTVNARFEELSAKASYRDPWKHGKRCVIPAASFDEPCWETGKNVWWRFRRADGSPWGVAGLWNTWTDKATGEIVESYTMLTINADAHPLMSRMHKPDPKLGPDQQDKRSLVLLEAEDVDAWLHAPVEQAVKLVRLMPADVFNAAPAVA